MTPMQTLEADVAILKGTLNQVLAQQHELGAMVSQLSKGRRIVWEEDTTASGIQLQGPSKVERSGMLVSATPTLTAQGLVLFVVAKRDDGAVAILNGPWKFVD